MSWGGRQSWQQQQGSTGGAKWQAPASKTQSSWGNNASEQKPNAAASGMAKISSSTYVCACTGPDSQEVVVRTLVGEYNESGSNHGRKVFKKSVNQGPEAVDVYMYYWDGRDGPAFQGWWFGNQIGGTQVWSHNSSGDLTPPAGGWKIPWDGEERPSVTVKPKVGAGGGAGGGAAGGGFVPTIKGAAGGGAWAQKDQKDDKVKAIQSLVVEVCKEAKSALEQARNYAGNYDELDGLQEAESTLVPQGSKLNDALKQLMENQRGLTGDSLKTCATLGAQVRTFQQQLNTELTKIRSGKGEAEKKAKKQESEAKDLAAFAEILSEAEGKANLAEDCVEKAVITSEMISAAGDDMDEVKQAVTQTEQAVQEAQKAIGEARIFLNAKQASTRRYESESAKKKAGEQLQTLQTQLQEAQTKLNPLKTARQDFLQRAAAQKVVAEVLEKLTPAEVDVDRAEEAAMILSTDSLSADLMKQADQSLQKAHDHIAKAMQFIETKKKGAQGLAKEEITKMEERAKASQARLAQLKNAQKEQNERVAADSMVKEAADKVQLVAEAVTKATDAEGPFLMGVEELPLDDTLAAVKACETASTAANTTVSIARMFIATKLVEAKRFVKGPSETAQKKLKEYQELLESHAKKLNELKAQTAQRKKKALMLEAESEVTKAEGLAKAVGEAAAVFENDEKLFALSSEEIKAAAEATSKAEAAANAALAEARKFITTRQIETKGSKDASSAMSAELIKYQTRLSTAQTEVGKHKKLSAGVESRLAAKKSIEEAATRVTAAEEKVSAVLQLIEGLEEQKEDIDKAVKTAEKSATEASGALKNVIRYIDLQTRQTGAAKDEIEKLRPRIKASQDKLDASVASMKAREDEIKVKQILTEAEERVKEVEDNMKKVEEAQAPLAKGDDLPVEDASKVLTELDTSIAAASNSVGGTKTFLAMKRLAAKRMGESAKASTTDALAKLQERLDAASKSLSEIKKGLAERKASLIRKEITATVEEVQKKVDAAVEATKGLDGAVDLSPDEMKKSCEKSGTAQGEAQTSIESARNLLLSRQKDAKTSPTEANTAMLAEISKLLETVQKLKATLDKQQDLLKEHEHKFVADRLLKDAQQMMDKLDKALESTAEVAAPLTSEKSADFTSVIYLMHIGDMVRQRRAALGKDMKQMFAEIGESSGKITEAQFVAYVGKLLELEENKDKFFSEEQQKVVFKRMLKGEATELTEDSFLEQFRSRYMVTTLVTMTDSLTVKGGKTVRKLEAGEVVEALDEPSKEETVGILRVKAKTEKDQKEGYITLSGNQGTVYLEPYSEIIACQKQFELSLVELSEVAKETEKYIGQKADELKSVRSGPLAETKAELLKMKPRISKVQDAQSELKKKVETGKKNLSATMENEKKKRQEAAEKKAAAEVLEEVEKEMKTVGDEVETVVTKADALAKTAGGSEENPLQAFDDAEKNLETAVASCEKVTTLIKEKLEAVKGTTKGPMGELRAALVKLKVASGTLDSRCKKQATALKGARKQVANDAHALAVSALVAHAQTSNVSAEALFKQLSDGAEDVSVDKLKDFLSKLPDATFKPGQLDVGLERYALGLTKLSLLEMLQEYLKCVKEIAITTAFEIKETKTIRKIAVGEVVEVLETPKVDAAVSGGLARAKCRAISDGVVGWVTIKGNQGTPFLDKGSKPYFCCESDTPLSTEFEATSAEVRALKTGEVVELLEGPRKEPATEIERMRGKAKNDGKVGWVTFKDATGAEQLEVTKMLVCKQSIAVTTTFDITEGKAIRKLDVGETLMPTDEEKLDEQRKLTRQKVKCTKDNEEGWVTIKGNQGTAYAEPSDKLYVCKRSMPLEARQASGSSTLRTLEEGEVFEVTDGPKTETKEGANRLKGRVMSDGTEGWFTKDSKTVKEWTPQYKCVSSTVLHDGMDIAKANAIRKLEPQELLQALATPALEKESGLLRVRVRTEKDGKTGFATLRGNQGTVMLENCGSAAGGSTSAAPSKSTSTAAPPREPPPAGMRPSAKAGSSRSAPPAPSSKR